MKKKLEGDSNENLNKYVITLNVIERVCNRAIDKNTRSTLQLIIILMIFVTVAVISITALMTVEEISKMSNASTNALIDNSMIDIEDDIKISI